MKPADDIGAGGATSVSSAPVETRTANSCRQTLASEEPSIARSPRSDRTYPFAAIVGQDEMRRALTIAAVDPTVGGVLVLGDRGTGKSTAVRALAALLPPIEVVVGCPFGCHPSDGARCAACADTSATGSRPTRLAPVPLVDLPLGATQDRVLGALDLERALSEGVKAFQPGLLAAANRGFLYIDEVNLLEDHLVDLLIDAAASGVNVVERDGLSVRHPARFVLVGSGNPEEGELRPQLLDRFGLCADVRTPVDIPTRVEIIKRREAFEQAPAAFVEAWRGEDARIRRQVTEARGRLADVEFPDPLLEQVARLCLALGTDGIRGELTLVRAARAQAALEGVVRAETSHVRATAALALRHRLRRNPLDDTGSSTRVERALDDLGLR
jgi:magnesium chelatase subunit I